MTTREISTEHIRSLGLWGIRGSGVTEVRVYLLLRFCLIITTHCSAIAL